MVELGEIADTFNLLCAVQTNIGWKRGRMVRRRRKMAEIQGLMNGCDHGWLTLDLHLSQRRRCTSFPVGSNSAVRRPDELVRR